jgi:hypothetical protein
MTFSFDDLSPAALETIADLIEERLDAHATDLVPVTWHQAQARRSAARELIAALDDAGLIQMSARQDLLDATAITLH